MRASFQTSRARLTPWRASEYDQLIAASLAKEKRRIASLVITWRGQATSLIKPKAATLGI
ncbi:hypothetical protein [Pedosphaera parvula]|uniref:Uncharacterized protein n=1 Tax=Pedosphaera parvula (strain Ellin514) TaxID=320771 RepID=B9XHA0_PEDPL|nr:hypothetical protein [Pedosphaera parvula]EEF60735.1 hypothetical protein Cflav_PD3593 [Pedosphaera parvula Ellin514]